MKAIPRRDALGALVAFPALTLLGAVRRVHPQPALPKFTPPPEPMRFSRKLVRNLSDGKQIIVDRAWRVLFKPVGNGFALDGEQISVEVEVPPGLEALAGLERSKRETGLFPLILTGDGMIMTKGLALPKPAIDQAVELANQELAKRKASEADRQASSAFLRTLQSSAEKAANRLPRDLFQPRQVSTVDERTLPLPDGTMGTVLIEFIAEVSAQTGLMERASRTVKTRIGSSERTSAERWSLASI